MIFLLIGVAVGRLITQGLFTVKSFIAVAGVTGVVVNDSLVLVDFINKRYPSAMPFVQESALACSPSFSPR